MPLQHKDLANSAMARFTLIEQLAAVGAEVGRSLNWKEKGNADYSNRAFERALELLDFTIADEKNRPGLRELCRLREALVDSFIYDNEYGSTPELWRKYFGAFEYAASRGK
jgi:hypothetical protein